MTKTAKIVFFAIWALSMAGCDRESPKTIGAAGVVDGTIVTIRSSSGGRLAAWTARPGQAVRKDEILGRLDASRVDNSLEELVLSEREVTLAEERARGQMPALQAKIDYMRRQMERLERLKTEQAVAGEEFEKARVELSGAEAGLADLRQSIAAQALQREKLAVKRRAVELAKDDLVLRAPADGVLLASHVTTGEIISPGAPAAEILDTSDLRIDVYVEEAELSRLRLGGRAVLRLDGRDGKEWSGTIIGFGSTAEFSPKFTLTEKERRSLLYKVTLRPESDPAVFKLGLPVTVIFDR
jgi:multidrug resistance efflux pump